MMMYATQCWTWPWQPWLPNFKNLSLKTLSSGSRETWLLWCRASAQAAWWWSPETSAVHPTQLCKRWFFSSPQLDILDLHEEVKLWHQTSHKDFCFFSQTRWSSEEFAIPASAPFTWCEIKRTVTQGEIPTYVAKRFVDKLFLKCHLQLLWWSMYWCHPFFADSLKQVARFQIPSWWVHFYCYLDRTILDPYI